MYQLLSSYRNHLCLLSWMDDWQWSRECDTARAWSGDDACATCNESNDEGNLLCFAVFFREDPSASKEVLDSRSHTWKGRVIVFWGRCSMFDPPLLFLLHLLPSTPRGRPFCQSGLLNGSRSTVTYNRQTVSVIGDWQVNNWFSIRAGHLIKVNHLNRYCTASPSLTTLKWVPSIKLSLVSLSIWFFTPCSSMGSQ